LFKKIFYNLVINFVYDFFKFIKNKFLEILNFKKRNNMNTKNEISFESQKNGDIVIEGGHRSSTQNTDFKTLPGSKVTIRGKAKIKQKN
jgi:hypothetical protein